MGHRLVNSLRAEIKRLRAEIRKLKQPKASKNICTLYGCIYRQKNEIDLDGLQEAIEQRGKWGKL